MPDDSAWPRAADPIFEEGELLMKRVQRAGLSLLLTALLCIASFAGVACFDESLKQPRRLGKKTEGSSKRVSTGREAGGRGAVSASGEAGKGTTGAGAGRTEIGVGTTGAETPQAGTTGGAER